MILLIFRVLCGFSLNLNMSTLFRDSEKAAARNENDKTKSGRDCAQ